MSVLFRPHLSLDLLASLLIQNEAAKPPLLGDEAVEQPNSKPVWGRGAENVTGEARRFLWVAGCGGFWEGWIVGACGEGLIFVAGVFGGRGQSLWCLECSGVREQRHVAKRKMPKSLRMGRFSYA
jgi:hypothetical protein